MRSLRWSSATCLWPRPHTNLALFTSGMATGQSVRILWGPFANVVGRLERLDAAVRVRVLLDIMGTTVPVAVRRGTFLPPREKAIPASRLEAKPDVISTGFRSQHCCADAAGVTLARGQIRDDHQNCAERPAFIVNWD